MTQAICFKNKFGYCKFNEKCFFRHVTIVCEDVNCNVFKCEKRHPKICNYYRDFRRCKFAVGCKYKHENQSEILEKMEKKLQDLETRNNDNDLAKQVEDKIVTFEKQMSNMRKE